MINFTIPINTRETIIALGPESAGNFSVCEDGQLFLSDNFGDLLDENNFIKFKKAVLGLIKKNKIKPDIILTDLHPLYKTTLFGENLSKKFKAEHIKIQHHLAHIFSAVGEKQFPISASPQALAISNFQFPISVIGIACDGTGFGLYGKIWGGEVFKVKSQKHALSKAEGSKVKSIERIGHLENQIMIGGDLAVKEPARMLISILNKFLNKKTSYGYLKKFYTKNQYEVLYNQLQQNFNCQETSSTGRILDAVSVLLNFSKNQRSYKHEPIDKLEKNSTTPYRGLKPRVVYDKEEKKHILLTTPLFQYLIKNLTKDKKRLAATAQSYIAQGLYQITSNFSAGLSNRHHEASGLTGDSAAANFSAGLHSPRVAMEPNCKPLLFEEFNNYHNTAPRPRCGADYGARRKSTIYLAGGIADNKIISSYLKSKGAITNKKIPRGDAGLSFGQIIYYLIKKCNDRKNESLHL